MKNEIKKIYNTLSGGKIITSDNYIISSSHFNSISRDRFVSELNKRGINWNGNDIVFSSLFDKDSNIIFPVKTIEQQFDLESNILSSNSNFLGIDIQEINELPDTSDYWEDEFYKSKFTPEEIAYCVERDNSKQSFSGIYSCKEALIKSNNNLIWSDINIIYNQNGKPSFQDYKISISHSGSYSIAIALKSDNCIIQKEDNNQLLSTDFVTNEVMKKAIKNNNIINYFFITILILIYSIIVFFKLINKY